MSDPEFERRLAANIARRSALIHEAMQASRRGDHSRLIELGRKWRKRIGFDRRRPPEGSVPALVEPPRGPLPLSGGAEAPLEFD